MDFTTFICYSLKVTMKKIERHLTQRLEEFGLNFPKSLIIFCLLEKDGSSLSEIGQRAQIENSSLTTMADRLEKDGFVIRKLDDQDRRMVRLFLTEKGRKSGEEILSEGIKFNNYLISQLNGQDQILVEALETIAKSMD